MGFFKNMRAARQKRVETRNDRKIKVAEAKYAAQAVGYENGVDPSAGAKIGPIIQTGLGMVKGFLGGNNQEPLPLPYDEGLGSNKMLIIGGGLAAVLVVAVLLKKK